MKTQSTPIETRLLRAAQSLGLSLSCSPPMPGVDKAQGKDANPWPHIAYTVTLTRNGKPVWEGPYKLGVGHVKINQREVSASFRSPALTAKEESLAQALVIKPHAVASDPAVHASLAAKLATRQKVSPDLPTVLSSLLSDGQPDFDGQSFEDWSGDIGYDTDSRSAEKTYNACVDIGRQLRRAFTTTELEQLREAAQDF